MTAGSTIDPAELLRLTGGNPFYVGAVIQAGLAAVPQSAGDAVLARTARLSAGAREALDAAALTGSRVEVPLLAAVTACRPAHLDELTASGLLSGDGGWLKFRHEIARLAVEQAIAGHRAAAIHAQILAALADLGPAEEARLAFHAEAAGDAAAVLRFAPLAARRAAEVASHREAAAQFERALRFAASADRDVVADLYDGIAREFSLLDRWQDAAEAGERALILWRAAGDRLREGDTLLRLSRTMWRLCRGKESAQAAEAALEVLMPLGPSVALARAYANLAVQRMTEGADDAAIDLAGRAVALAESLGVTEVLSDALNTRACALEHAGRDASGLLRRALDIALAGRLDEQAGRAYANLHALDCSRRQFAAAERLYLEGIAFCDDHDIGTYATCLRGERTGYLEKTGRWDEGALLAADLLARAGASPVNRLNPLISLGKIRARRAEPGAWECLDEAALAADASAEPSPIVAARLARAEAHWLRGEPAAARGQAELAADAAAWCDSWERGAIAAWLRRTGSDRSLDGEFPPPFAAELAGDWAAAARGWHELGCPYDEALALLDGPDDCALREALAIFDALGAAAAARMTRQKMRRLGLRSIPAGPQTATRANPRGLTRREREVLDLICAGQTNAQIAERLFISVKTVHHHVSAVLAKLGVPSRNAAAAEAAQLGLAGAAESR
jgi:DNA-binding CsgD family transcriptional regulator